MRQANAPLTEARRVRAVAAKRRVARAMFALIAPPVQRSLQRPRDIGDYPLSTYNKLFDCMPHFAVHNGVKVPELIRRRFVLYLVTTNNAGSKILPYSPKPGQCVGCVTIPAKLRENKEPYNNYGYKWYNERNYFQPTENDCKYQNCIADCYFEFQSASWTL